MSGGHRHRVVITPNDVGYEITLDGVAVPEVVDVSFRLGEPGTLPQVTITVYGTADISQCLPEVTLEEVFPGG